MSADLRRNQKKKKPSSKKIKKGQVSHSTVRGSRGWRSNSEVGGKHQFIKRVVVRKNRHKISREKEQGGSSAPLPCSEAGQGHRLISHREKRPAGGRRSTKEGS